MREESIQRRDAENAEISAERTKSKPKTNPNPPQGQPFLRLSYVFSALPLRSLRLCVERAFLFGFAPAELRSVPC